MSSSIELVIAATPATIKAASASAAIISIIVKPRMRPRSDRLRGA
ncbi:MAG: hypothetical protein WDN30_04685 [Pararobbsia sp.]